MRKSGTDGADPSVGTSGPLVVGRQNSAILAEPAAWRAQFEHARHFVLPDLIDPDFLPTLLERCDRADYVRDDRSGLYAREVEAPQRVGSALNLIMTRAPLLRWIEAATGVGALVRCEGRLVRTCANDRDKIDWHDDDLPARRLGFVLNLSAAPFVGGAFQLRRKGTVDLLCDFIHERPGTAMIFDVNDDFEHRVLPITQGGPRRMFSGWFIAAGQGRAGVDVIS